MNGVGIGIPAVITAAALQAIRRVPRAGRTVCGGAVAGAAMPTTAGLRIGTTATRTAATTASASASAGQSHKF